MKLFNQFLFLAVLGLAVSSCSKDDPDDGGGNEEELITTLNYELTPDDGGAIVTLTFKDIDGDGGNAPVITGGTLQANTTYSGAIELLNESESPAEDITEEIREEDEEHQLFVSSSVAGITVTYLDMDEDNNPIGLATQLVTGDAGSGNISIILRHEPNKSAEGVADGNIANAGGSTDIEVSIPVTVE